MTLTEGRAPGAWPLLGHFNAMRRHPLRFLETVGSQGDLVEFRIGPRSAFMLCHPDLAYQMLTDLRTFDRTGMMYDRVRGAMGNGLATAAHHDHRRQRLIMQPAFRREHLRGYAAVMSREVTALTDRWSDGDCVDMVDEMFRLTTSVALRALFSSRIDDGQADRLRDAFDVFLRGVYTRLALPGFERLPPPREPAVPGGAGAVARPGPRAHRGLPPRRRGARRSDVPAARRPRRPGLRHDRRGAVRPGRRAAAGRRRDDVSYLPFGAGATKCIGDEFGTTEATLALASLVSRWRFTPRPAGDPFPAARLVLVPHSLPVTLRSRRA